MSSTHLGKLGRLLWAGLVCIPIVSVAGEPPPASPKVIVVETPPAPAPSGDLMTALAVDAETKVYAAKVGDAVATFTFYVTNTSDTHIHILYITPSCSCTRAEMPQVPWVIAPHTQEELHATMNLANKPPGDNVKFLTIFATNGTKQLWVKAIVPMPPAVMSDREKNQELAKADRQAVFREDCARCHAETSRGLVGAALYKQACGICHDSPHRATVVPDLGSLTHPTDAAFWRSMTADGKEKTLMPAFAQRHGGPLTDDQIESLVTYLTTEFPVDHKPTPQVPLPPTTPAPALPPPHTRSQAPSSAVPSLPVRANIPATPSAKP